jgi:hypothetical protein
MADNKPTERGGKRPGAGRKSKDGIRRPAQINIRTTEETAEWFSQEAVRAGGTGPAIEGIHRERLAAEMKPKA